MPFNGKGSICQQIIDFFSEATSQNAKQIANWMHNKVMPNNFLLYINHKQNNLTENKSEAIIKKMMCLSRMIEQWVWNYMYKTNVSNGIWYFFLVWKEK